MNIFKNLFIFNRKSELNNELTNGVDAQYIKIAKLVKQARIEKDISIREL